MKQSFHIEAKDGRVFGCSIRKANYNPIYFGWVSEYPSKEAYNNFDQTKHWYRDIKNIPLADTKEKSINELKEYITTL